MRFMVSHHIHIALQLYSFTSIMGIVQESEHFEHLHTFTASKENNTHNQETKFAVSICYCPGLSSIHVSFFSRLFWSYLCPFLIQPRKMSSSVLFSVFWPFSRLSLQLSCHFRHTSSSGESPNTRSNSTTPSCIVK